MKRWLVLAIAAVVLAVAAAVTFAGLYFTKNTEPEPVAAPQCGEKIFGHIRSLVRRGDHYVLRFDPAWFTLGETANTAAAEDGAVEPGEPVPNDVYVIDESHRLLTYLVRPGAHVTVLVNNADGDPVDADQRRGARGDRPHGQEQPPQALRDAGERRVGPLPDRHRVLARPAVQALN